MKFSTLLYIRDLLKDRYVATVKREDEAKEQVDSLPPESSEDLVREITFKWQAALSDRLRADEAVQDFLKHQWK